MRIEDQDSLVLRPRYVKIEPCDILRVETDTEVSRTRSLFYSCVIYIDVCIYIIRHDKIQDVYY